MEGKIQYISKNTHIISIDFGFKQDLESFFTELMITIPTFESLNETCNYIQRFSIITFKILVLQNFFLNEILIKKTIFLDFKLFLFLFSKQRKSKKIYFKSRILNVIRGGFCIGTCGFTGFLPKSQSALKFQKVGSITICFILNIDKIKKSLLVSQYKTIKITQRRLQKLKALNNKNI